MPVTKSMYSRSKYIVGKFGHLEYAIVFDEGLTHSDMRPAFQHGEIISAGFCHYSTDGVKVYGESISLRVASRPEDERLVGRAMSHPEYVI